MNSSPAIEEATKLSIVKDPFNKNCMVGLWVHCNKSNYSGWSYSGSVNFENGNTKGEQKFNGESLKDVLLKVEAFILTLEETS